MVFVYKNNALCECISLTEALAVNASVISVVGAGGKTTLLHRLEEDYVRKNQQVIVTTTTKILYENKPYFSEDTSIDKIKYILKKYGRVWVGRRDYSSGKMTPPAKEVLDNILRWNLPVLIEADGAKQMPVKVPAEHEPVIIDQTGHVVSVYGLDAVGRTLETSCFRGERAESILKKSGKERITSEDIAVLASSDKAGRKGCPADAEYTVVLNKADNAARRETALEICRELTARGVKNIAVTSLNSL